jgi:hypothetical protein
MRLEAEAMYRRAKKLVPPGLVGRIDLFRPDLRSSWGGPLNGQERRRDIVRELARTVAFERVIETGTYRGSSTEFFVAVFGTPVATVESSTRYFTYSKYRLSVHPNVSLTLGDSRQFLRMLAESSGRDGETVFVYLDAHWYDDLPLADELRLVAAGWKRGVVMVDDFQVPGDDGYTYDDYGPGMALVESYLPEKELSGWSLFYPSARSGEETGLKRGCCVLVSESLVEQISGRALRLARRL